MPKIAIIDDDSDIVDAVSMVLQSKGYKVVSAMNLEGGMDLVASESPDLIILDVMMEESDDGFYFAAKMRKNGLKTPMIMLTSVSKATGMTYGPGETVPVNEFIEKPVSPGILLDKVDYWLTHGEGKQYVSL